MTEITNDTETYSYYKEKKAYNNSGYQAVTPTGTENPSEKCWYENDNNTYKLSTDTTVDTGKTYYNTIYTEVTPVGAENPSEEGWYELSLGTYALSIDVAVESSKTYYELSYTAVTPTGTENPNTEGMLSVDASVKSGKTYYERVNPDAVSPESVLGLTGSPQITFTNSVWDKEYYFDIGKRAIKNGCEKE